MSIILLENLPVPEAPALFLSQRAKTVRDILAHSPKTSTSTPRLSPIINQRRGNSRALSTPMSREAIGTTLTQAVQCLLDTAAITSAVFDRRKRSPEGDSLIGEMMRLVQVGVPVSAPPPVTPMRRTSHQRRASRLASMSLPFPKIGISSTGLPVSTRQILQSLPSSQILLRHLPSSITAFTPFITPSPPPAVTEKIAAWRNSSTQLLRDAVPAWLAGLHSVIDIWHVRASLGSMLPNGDFENEIRAALEAEWGARVKDVWNDKLEALVRSSEERIRGAGEQIRLNGEELGKWTTSAFLSPLIESRHKCHVLHVLRNQFSGRSDNIHDDLPYSLQLLYLYPREALDSPDTIA